MPLVETPLSANRVSRNEKKVKIQVLNLYGGPVDLDIIHSFTFILVLQNE